MTAAHDGNVLPGPTARSLNRTGRWLLFWFVLVAIVFGIVSAVARPASVTVITGLIVIGAFFVFAFILLIAASVKSRGELHAGYSTMMDSPNLDLRDYKTKELLRPAGQQPSTLVRSMTGGIKRSTVLEYRRTRASLANPVIPAA